MRTVEQNFLKNYIDNIASNHCEFPTQKDLVSFLNTLDGVSLQEKCREFDYEFLGNLSRVISVIMSITEHPHISSAREEIIARIEQVKQISNEDFTRSIRESSFWKQRGIDMIPEKVYHYQQVDELLLYENKFICMLIDLLDQELTQYLDLYTNMLPSVNTTKLNKVEKNLVLSLKKINLLKKRISLLKNTRFYKILSKTPKISRNIQKTNILIHDNLYKQCYIFYTKFMIYSDSGEILKDLKKYFQTIIARELSKRGYLTLESSTPSVWSFENQDFRIDASLENEISGITFSVQNKECGKIETHLLIISPSLVRDDVELPEEGKYDSVDILTIWNIISSYDLADAKLVSSSNESELISSFIESKTAIVTLNHDVYSKVCPVCKSKVSENDEGEISCPICQTKYRYLSTLTDTYRIWFTNLGENHE